MRVIETQSSFLNLIIFHKYKESDGPPTDKPVNVRVTGTALADAVNAKDRLKSFMQQNSELADLVDLADNRPDFHKTF